MINVIFMWFKEHIFILYLMGGISLFLFITTVVIVPLILIHLPPDFLINIKRKKRVEKIHFTIHILLMIIKNLIGIILVAAGVLMLILPGQGIITIFIGLILVDFPGKRKLVFYILSNPIILNTINWIRKKNRKKDLMLFDTKKHNS
ncbi:MAG: hypothetical protein JXB88_12390 [Spirochaetales bacterium]|nr:hypothetical protein [Spirochaetales bacterium]